MSKDMLKRLYYIYIRRTRDTKLFREKPPMISLRKDPTLKDYLARVKVTNRHQVILKYPI